MRDKSVVTFIHRLHMKVNNNKIAILILLTKPLKTSNPFDNTRDGQQKRSACYLNPRSRAGRATKFSSNNEFLELKQK